MYSINSHSPSDNFSLTYSFNYSAKFGLFFNKYNYSGSYGTFFYFNYYSSWTSYIFSLLREVSTIIRWYTSFSYHFCSSTNVVPLIRTQCQNISTITKVLLERIEATMPMSEAISFTQVSSPSIKNYYNPLSNIDREKDFRRITIKLPPLIISSIFITIIDSLMCFLCIGKRRIGIHIGWWEKDILHDLGAAILRKLWV